MRLPSTCTNAAYTLRLNYLKYLYCYEQVFFHSCVSHRSQLSRASNTSSCRRSCLADKPDNKNFTVSDHFSVTDKINTKITVGGGSTTRVKVKPKQPGNFASRVKLVVVSSRFTCALCEKSLDLDSKSIVAVVVRNSRRYIASVARLIRVHVRLVCRVAQCLATTFRCTASSRALFDVQQNFPPEDSG